MVKTVFPMVVVVLELKLSCSGGDGFRGCGLVQLVADIRFDVMLDVSTFVPELGCHLGCDSVVVDHPRSLDNAPMDFGHLLALVVVVEPAEPEVRSGVPSLLEDLLGTQPPVVDSHDDRNAERSDHVVVGRCDCPRYQAAKE